MLSKDASVNIFRLDVFDPILLTDISVNLATGTFNVVFKDTSFLTIKLPDISTSLLKDTSSNLICLSKY